MITIKDHKTNKQKTRSCSSPYLRRRRSKPSAVQSVSELVHDIVFQYRRVASYAVCDYSLM